MEGQRDEEFEVRGDVRWCGSVEGGLEEHWTGLDRERHDGRETGTFACLCNLFRLDHLIEFGQRGNFSCASRLPCQARKVRRGSRRNMERSGVKAVKRVQSLLHQSSLQSPLVRDLSCCEHPCVGTEAGATYSLPDMAGAIGVGALLAEKAAWGGRWLVEVVVYQEGFSIRQEQSLLVTLFTLFSETVILKCDQSCHSHKIVRGKFKD